MSALAVTRIATPGIDWLSIAPVAIVGLTAVAIVLSPAFGFLFAAMLMIVVSWIWSRSSPRRVDRWFNKLQFVSAALYSLGHGSNDAQKTMGII